MGSAGMNIAESLLSKGAEHLEGLFNRGVSNAEGSRAGRGALNLIGNQSWEMGLTEGGQAIEKMHNEYIRVHDASLGTTNKQLQAVRDFHANSPAARQALDPAKATMMDYHLKAAAENHPAQQVTSQLVSDPEVAKMTQEQYLIRGQKIARLNAIAGSYGDKFKNATPIIARMLQDSDPRVVSNAHRLADIVSNQVRDTKMFSDSGGTNTEQSAAKYYMNKAFKKANKVYEKAEMGQRIPLLDTEKTYTRPSDTERTAHRVMDTMLIPFVAVKHIGQIFNPIASSPLPALGAALLRMDHAGMSKTIDASGIVASTMWRAMYRDVLGESGHVAEWTKSPTLGKIMARTFHSPGMTFVRRTQINLAGSVGFHSAIYWAHNFAENGSRIAEMRLKEMQINPADVVKQGGKLTDDQLQKGVYHFVNNREFMNRSIDNALYQNRDVITRSAYMYHAFVNNQASFMMRDLLKMAKVGDYKGIAQFVGTLGVLFPAVAAPILGSADVLLRTASLKQATTDLQDKYRKMAKPNSAGEWLGNYLQLVSHLGAAGVYFNYINAIKANRLAAALAGPMIGAATTDLTDAVHAGFMPSAKGERNFAPIERDVLKQTIPVFGSALAHHFAPTLAEKKARGEGAHKGLTLSRQRSGRRR